MATASSVSPKKKARSMEARRRRSRNKKTNARVKSQKSPYLLPELCDSDVHEDCVAIDCEMMLFTLKTVPDEMHWHLSPSSIKSSSVFTRSSYNHLPIIASTKVVVNSVR